VTPSLLDTFVVLVTYLLTQDVELEQFFRLIDRSIDMLIY